MSGRNLSMILALGGIGAFFAVAEPSFLGARNLSMLMIELSITALLALGMLLVLLPGQVDLSVGSGVGLTGGLAAVLVFHHGWPAPAAMAVALAGALVVWRLMAGVIVRHEVPAFIMTLGGLLVGKGLHWLVIRNSTVPVAVGGQQNALSLLTTLYLSPASGWVIAGLVTGLYATSVVGSRRRRRALDLPVENTETAFMKVFVAGQVLCLLVAVANAYRGLPLAAVILGAGAFAIHVITAHTAFGRSLYAVGGNAEAAFVSGIPVDRVVIGAFTLLGGIVAVTGFLQTAYAGASTSTVGSLMELDAIAACVIGGTSLRGGRGTVAGVLFGSLIMASLLNGMTLIAVSPEAKLIARGVVLALAVWLDVRLTRRAR